MKMEEPYWIHESYLQIVTAWGEGNIVWVLVRNTITGEMSVESLQSEEQTMNMRMYLPVSSATSSEMTKMVKKWRKNNVIRD